MNSRAFSVRDLRLVAPAPPADYPPLGVGDHCRLTCGSPMMLVTDVHDLDVVVGWEVEKGVSKETLLPRTSVRRA